jgi:hypothetical protein
MRNVVVSLCALGLLGGCGQSSDPAPQARTTPIKVQGEAQKQLAAANEMDRSIGLKRAIYASGSRCSRVIRTGQMADYKNMSMWQAICEDGGNWAVYIAPNGAVQVRACADLKGLALPQCTLPVGNDKGTKRQKSKA